MNEQANPAARRHVNPWIILGLVCMAQFMVVLDATVVNVALPSIQRGLNFSMTDLQWIVNGYTLTFGGFLLLGGRAGDLFGRQRIFLAGLTIFTLASLFNGLATSPSMLIIGRAIQGFGGALISPAALSIITTTFDEGAPRNKALAVWSGIAASGAAFGLLIGGSLTQWASWRWAFFVNVPVGVVTLMLSLNRVPNTRVAGEKGIDVAGAVAVTGGLMAIVYALAQVSPEHGWTSGAVVGPGLAGLVLLGMFVVIESIYRAPIVRLSIFKTRSLTVANLAMFAVAGGMFSMFFFMSILIQGVLGYSPFQTGLAFLPVCVGIGAGAGIASQLIKVVDVRFVSGLGMSIAAAGYLLMLRIGVDATYLSVLLPALVVMSLGMGLTFVPVTLLATTNVAEKDAGLSSGLLNTSQQIGGALGLAILATVASNRTIDYITTLGHAPSRLDSFVGLVEGYRVAFFCGALLLLFGAVLVVAFIRKSDVAGIATGHADAAGGLAEGEAVA